MVGCNMLIYGIDSSLELKRIDILILGPDRDIIAQNGKRQHNR